MQIAGIWMCLSFPVLALGQIFPALPVMRLIFFLLGTGTILIALMMALAEIHFRHVAVAILASVISDPRIVTIRARKYGMKVYRRLILARFIAQSGEDIMLELAVEFGSPIKAGQLIQIFSVPQKPQVASTDNHSALTSLLAACCFLAGIVLIVACISSSY